MSRYQDPSKGIFLPETRGKRRLYKFGDLIVGETRRYRTSAVNLRSSFDAWNKSRQAGWKVAIRKVDHRICTLTRLA